MVHVHRNWPRWFPTTEATSSEFMCRFSTMIWWLRRKMTIYAKPLLSKKHQIDLPQATSHRRIPEVNNWHCWLGVIAADTGWIYLWCIFFFIFHFSTTMTHRPSSLRCTITPQIFPFHMCLGTAYFTLFLHLYFSCASLILLICVLILFLWDCCKL